MVIERCLTGMFPPTAFRTRVTGPGVRIWRRHRCRSHEALRAHLMRTMVVHRAIRVLWPATMLLLFITSVVRAQDVLDIGHMAERNWAGRADIAQAKQAAAHYEEMSAEDPENAEAYWKLSRTYFWIGRHGPSSQAKNYFEKGIALAKQAVVLRPQEAGGHFWLGVNSGALAEVLGLWPWVLPRRLSLVGDFRREMHTVIRLDPAFEGGGAYRALGVYYLEKPFPDPREAETFLLEAVGIAPALLCNHFYLAVAYARQGKVDLAHQRRLHVLEAPLAADYVPEDMQCREDARSFPIS